ncbi:hypothetical protein KC19_VG239400 [Ceratodon purpureus]|uniref:Uncharacterized protein n=1 Tax=Ceratodon purpureus TaxID=3225 RepID=A0A8T0HTS1_CERPU|nr:hypothetical protein KC19_VG239400 [Ceratodon purpureus]
MHFARGVLAEYDGVAVDWAQYAVSLHRKGTHNSVTKKMTKYRNPCRPIPWKNPRPIPQAPSPDPSFEWQREFSPLESRSPGINIPPTTPAWNVEASSGRELQSDVHKRGSSVSRGKQVAVSTDSGGSSPPPLAVEGLVKLTNAIRHIAHEQRQEMAFEAGEFEEKIRVAKEKFDVASAKLVSPHRIHRSWAEIIPGAETLHCIALALRERSQTHPSNIPKSVYDMGQYAPLPTVDTVWEDTLLVARTNLEFVKDRVEKLRESIMEQEKAVGDAEATFNAVRVEANKNLLALKSDTEKMDALIQFLGHRDFFGKA